MIRDLIFSGSRSGLFAGHGEKLLHSLALRAGTQLVDPLAELIMAPAAQWSLAKALALIAGGNGDYLARLALLELVCRDLGRRWCSDDLDFTRVTVGTARIQLIMRSREFRQNMIQPASRPGKILITAPPGEDHLFAPTLIEELFRSQGWYTTSRFFDRMEDLNGAIIAERYDLACISWSNSTLHPEAMALVQHLRIALPLPATLIIAGGNSALENQAALNAQGVDFVCANGYVGLAVAERHISETPLPVAG